MGVHGRQRTWRAHARAALLLATEPLDRVTGRVGYSQQLLAEFGLLEDPHGTGVDRPGSGYAQQ